MAFVQGRTDNTLQYLWVSGNRGQGMKDWTYITTDADTAVEVSGYFTGGDVIAGFDVGDMITVYRLAALPTATQTIQEAMAGGIVDISLHSVVTKTATTIDITTDLLGATVTYTA